MQGGSGRSISIFRRNFFCKLFDNFIKYEGDNELQLIWKVFVENSD